MADSVQSSDSLERYAAIERSYCEERWTSVIYDGQSLLADLSRVDQDPPEGLKERLQLLIAHAFLYGLGDRDSAEDLYQAVLRSGAEASLRQIADQGLQQCAQPFASADSQDERLQQEDPSSEPAPAPTATTTEWPDAAELPVDNALSRDPGSAPSRQEGSAALQGLQDRWPAASPSAPSGEDGALRWLTVEANGAPPDSATLPVMPWLEPVPDAGVDRPSSLDQARGAADQIVRRDPPTPVTESLPLQDDQAWMLATGTPAQADASLDLPVAAGESDSQSLPLEGEMAVGFAVGSASAHPVTPVAAALQTPLNGPPTETADVGMPGDASDLVLAVADAPVAMPPAGDVPEMPSARSSWDAAEESLVAEIVDEPELIELYQADRLRHQELLIQPAAEVAPPLSVAERGEQLPAEPGVPAAGWDRRASDGVPTALTDRRAEQALDAVPAAAPLPISEGPRHPEVSGMGPFSAPPQPVTEEDPELLMGLLKVEMG